MVGIHREGWDFYTGTGLQVGIGGRQGYVVAGGPVFVAGRYGGQAVSLFQASVVCPWDAAVPNFTWSGSIRFLAGAGTRTRDYLRFGNLWSQYIGGSWEWYNSAGLIGLIPNSVINSNTAWYDVQIEVVNATTTSGRMSIYLNGDPTPALHLPGITTSQLTCGSTTYGPSNFNNSPSMEVDDCYVIDSATRLPNLVKIDTVGVDTDGAILNFTPSTGTNHAAMVGEIPATATGYLSGTTVGQKDELGVATYAPNPAPLAIYEIAPYFFAQKMDAGTRAMALDLISGAATSAGSDYYLSGNGGGIQRVFHTDPAGGAWTPTGISNAQLVPRISV